MRVSGITIANPVRFSKGSARTNPDYPKTFNEEKQLGNQLSQLFVQHGAKHPPLVGFLFGEMAIFTSLDTMTHPQSEKETERAHLETVLDRLAMTPGTDFRKDPASGRYFYKSIPVACYQPNKNIQILQAFTVA